jgi:hypothetical protein
LASLYISLAVPSGKSTILFDDCPNVVFPCLSSLSMSSNVFKYFAGLTSFISHYIPL